MENFQKALKAYLKATKAGKLNEKVVDDLLVAFCVDSDSFDDSSRDQDNQLDGKFDLAVEHARIYCANSNKGISVTELQSELKIGFVRARNIHRQLQQQGIIDSKGFLL